MNTKVIKADFSHSMSIKCTIADQLLARLPISVAFFYSDSIDINLLSDGLRNTLIDFPIFGGSLRITDGGLFLDCSNKGVKLTSTHVDARVSDYVNNLTKVEKHKIVEPINLGKSTQEDRFLTTVQVVYFKCGGMSIGVTWHHSVGDMHTFMRFMHSWSSNVNGEAYNKPLLIEDRPSCIADKLKDTAQDNTSPIVRSISSFDFLRFSLNLLIQAKSSEETCFFFSDHELEEMRKDFSETAGLHLSRIDCLCSHMISQLSAVDDQPHDREIALAVNYRRLLDLPQSLLGNFISNVFTDYPKEGCPHKLAATLTDRKKDGELLLKRLAASSRYIKAHAKDGDFDRIIPNSINPDKGTIFITSWANFGAYKVDFNGITPFFFTPFGDYALPWICSINEGFDGNGLLFSAVLPKSVAARIKEQTSLEKLHSYRKESSSDCKAQSANWIH